MPRTIWREPQSLAALLSVPGLAPLTPADSQDLYLGSLAAIGLDPKDHMFALLRTTGRFSNVWSLGLGWRLAQRHGGYAHILPAGGIEVDPVPAESHYGLERIVIC